MSARCVLALIFLAGCSASTAGDVIKWNGDIREVYADRSGGFAFSLDGKVTMPYACGDGDLAGMVGLAPGDVSAGAIPTIDRMLTTVEMAMESRRNLEVTIDGCSSNGMWYRLNSVRLASR